MVDSNINIKNGFTMVDNDLIGNKNLTDGEFRTLVLLKSYRFKNNDVFPSQKTMANRLDVSRMTIINHLKGLKRKDFISWKKRGYSMSNKYTFNSQKMFTFNSSISQKNFNSINKNSLPQKSKMFEPNNTTNKKEVISSVNNILSGEKLRKKIKEIRKNVIEKNLLKGI